MFRTILVVAAFAFVRLTEAADVKYPVAEIPDSLKKDVDAVVRERIITFNILSVGRANLVIHEAITILNGGGRNHATVTLGYDRLEKIISLKATVYDADGRQVKKLKPQDIQDESSFDGYTLFSDQRVKIATLTHHEYPYTVEFDYEVDYKYLYAIPGCIVGSEKLAIQQLKYTLSYPKELKPRYKMIGLSTSPAQEVLSGDREKLSWAFANIGPVRDEPHSPTYLERIPRIAVAPSAFEYDGFAGDMASWESYGKWNATLTKGRDVLPEETKIKVKALTSGPSTTEQKTKAVYEYMQGKTRYVSIQEGIGGLQPFPADVVDRTGYGDCKALSNYMIALLKEAGIKGYYTRIRAGDDEPDLFLDFPSHQTNHIIVAVPDGRDTLWMECTSQKAPFGYLGSFTGNRHALMITEAGGRLVRTPGLAPEQNTQTRYADVTVDAQGNAIAKVRTLYRGEQTENEGLDECLDAQREIQKKWIQESTEIPSFSVGTFSFSGEKTKVPWTTVSVELILNRFASVSGKRIFVTPNLMNRMNYIPEKVEERRTEVVRYSGYVDIDTIVFRVPESFHPEFIPPAFTHKSKFGEYTAEVKFSQGQIQYVRRLKMFRGRFAKETYTEFVDFFKNINKADNLRLVLVNKS